MTQRFSIRLGLFVAAGLAISAVGCGGDDEASDDEETSASIDGGGGSKGASGKAGSGSKGGNDERPNVDGIPLDVFYPDPLVVASETGTVVASNPTTEPGTATPETTTTEEPVLEPPATGKVTWDKIITVDMLKGEMKSVRLQLQQRLMTLASYNSSYLEIPVFGSTLGLMAEVARRHPGDVSWKDDAKYIRVLSAKMTEVCSSAAARGRKSYDEVNESFLKICSILDNNSPAELPEADDEADLLDVAEMGYLMKRMKRAMEWMQNNTGSEESFKENAELAGREVSVIAAIAQAIKDESYGYGEDGEFKGHATEMGGNASEMSKAAKGGNFNEFDQLRSKVDQKCTQCHMTYLTG
ncbi:MAG: hypothetical protein H8E37_03780 [Planctomycetes bacterium]|nr:hypothetical protein [Planctomycetota bacterium]